MGRSKEKKEKDANKTSDPKKSSDHSSKTSSSTSSKSSHSRTHKGSSRDRKVEVSKTVRDERGTDLQRSLWVSKLSSETKAVDLKDLFAQQGKVIGAKVVTSAKTPGSNCFGYVTMSTLQEAALCIEKFNHSTLHDHTIEVEKAKTDPTPSKKPADKTSKPEEKSKSSLSSKSGTSSHSRHAEKSSH